MLIIKNKRYIKKHVVGGGGIFDTVSGFLRRLVTSDAAKSLSRAVASDIGNAAKTIGKELATSAISTVKDIAIEKGKRKISSLNSPKITQKSKDILASLVRSDEVAGQGMARRAVRIQDLVKRLNGGGLRIV